jgi:hypothetical protein
MFSDPLSGPTKDYKIGIRSLSAKHTSLMLARNQNNISERRHMSTRGLLLQ